MSSRPCFSDRRLPLCFRTQGSREEGVGERSGEGEGSSRGGTGRLSNASSLQPIRWHRVVATLSPKVLVRSRFVLRGILAPFLNVYTREHWARAYEPTDDVHAR